MKIAILPALAGGLLLAGTAFAPAGAVPARHDGVATPASGVEIVRHTRKHRRHLRRKGMRRHGTGRRAYAPSQAGNAKHPERPVYQQGQGQTTGGPRY